jgi:hypothetical protein
MSMSGPLRHGDIYHLKAEKLGDRKMSVITGHGAEPFEFALFIERNAAVNAKLHAR